MKKEIYLFGVGNYTEVIIELAMDCGYEVKGLYHYDNLRTGEENLGIPIIGSTEELFKTSIKNINFGVTVGDNRLRQEIAQQIRKKGGLTPTLIHPRAYVSQSAEIGEGCFIHLNSKVSTQCKLGDDCVVDFSCLVGHHAVLGNASYLSSAATVGSYCSIGERVLMGMNSLLLPLRLKLGKDCIVGGKANVTKSFGDGNVLIGNPARILKK